MIDTPVRPETESLTSHLAHLLSQPSPHRDAKHRNSLRILDLCTGTGCISLLLHSLLSPSFSHLSILGIDNAPAAIALANKNKAYNIRLRHLQSTADRDLTFLQDDVLSPRPGAKWLESCWDVLIANPPYISPRLFDTETSRSVRNWEPKAALVPFSGIKSNAPGQCADASFGDAFYPNLLDIAAQVSAKVVLFEVAGLEQAMRVAGMIGQRVEWDGYEIWRDWPWEGVKVRHPKVQVDGRDIEVKGEGHGRAVLAWRREGGRMLGMLST